MKQIDAQLELIDAQLARMRLTAPFSGVVVSGDLSQSLGSPVEHGQVLFEVAPLDAYRVILEVEVETAGGPVFLKVQIRSGICRSTNSWIELSPLDLSTIK